MRDRSLRVLILSGLLALPGARSGAQPPDDLDEQAPGLQASFASTADRDRSSVRARRIDPDLAWDWGRGAPDPRVTADEFVARWSGLILIQTPGPHRFRARTDGSATLVVAGESALDGGRDGDWSGPVDLPAGFAPLEVAYRHDRGPARLAIDWEGPSFSPEPLPARLLFHDRLDAEGRPLPTPDDRFEEGRRLADRLGCANCHKLLDLPRHPEQGPPLEDAGRAIDPGYLAAWLTDPIAVRPGSRMPAVGPGLGSGEAADLAAFLRSIAPKPRAPIDVIRMALNVADPDRGRLLFRSVGCLGCHSRDAVRALETGRAAPDLSDLGRKRSAVWLASFLARPKKSGNARHRPDLSLSDDESAHLAAYLAADPPAAVEPPSLPEGDPARGRSIAGRLRCASCHEIPGLSSPEADLPLSAGSDPTAGCLADAPRANVPRFAIDSDRRETLRAFVAKLPADPSPTAPRTLAEDAIRRRNCLGCHARDGRGGLALGEQVAEALADDPRLGSLKGTLTPPNLSAVGDKLRRDSLAESVRGRAPTARPWLSVRMPEFPYADGEADAIVDFLRGHDRMAAAPDPEAIPTQPEPAKIEAAVALIGQRGFGCVNCHVLAGRIPPGGEPETLGPDLALAHRRMTERYFHRWIANPQRIIPGTPMPQFVQPVAVAVAVANAPKPGTLDDQLETLWQLLGSDRVAEVSAFGTREILRPSGDRALVVRDMVLLPEAPGGPHTPRAVAIGLGNDFSLLFDTDRLAWLAWWKGGFLSRTKSGRLWEWHPEGDRLWSAIVNGAPLAFLDDRGKAVGPVEVRERFGTFTELLFDGPGVTLRYVLNGPGGSSIPVEERVQPTADGWTRVVRVSSIPEGVRPILVERLPPAPDGDLMKTLRWNTAGLRVSLLPGKGSQIALTDDGIEVPMGLEPEGTYVGRLRLEARDAGASK